MKRERRRKKKKLIVSWSLYLFFSQLSLSIYLSLIYLSVSLGARRTREGRILLAWETVGGFWFLSDLSHLSLLAFASSQQKLSREEEEDSFLFFIRPPSILRGAVVDVRVCACLVAALPVRRKKKKRMEIHASYVREDSLCWCMCRWSGSLDLFVFFDLFLSCVPSMRSVLSGESARERLNDAGAREQSKFRDFKLLFVSASLRGE